jgi:threonine/homoserine/homoserine lactone efflux protein
MDLIILKGFIAGFTLAAPGEAMGFLEIKETERSAAIGITAGFAAATADLVYGILAVIILQISSPLLAGDQPILTVLGGLFLCLFGIKRFLDTPSLNKVKRIDGSLHKTFTKTFVFTLTNVSTILEFVSLFIGFDIEFTGYHELLFFVAGVFLGSLFWWICLSITDKIAKKRISRKILRYLNYISGITIFAFGLYTLHELLIN